MKSKIKIFYIEELQKIDLPIIAPFNSPYQLEVGDSFITAQVVGMWDFKDYSKYLTYFQGDVQMVVTLNTRTELGSTGEFLRKDLENVKFYKQELSNHVTN